MRFPVIVSALFDAPGILRGIRLVTDLRPDHRSDVTEADLRKREEAYLFGGIMAARYNIDAARDCKALPPAEGESAVGDLFVKQSCETTDRETGRRIVLRANLFRKPGQSAVNPQLPTRNSRPASSKAQRGSKSTNWKRVEFNRWRKPQGTTMRARPIPSRSRSYDRCLVLPAVAPTTNSRART